MNRNSITSAIVLAFGLTGPAWATTTSDDTDVGASTVSLAGGAAISAAKNKATQNGAVEYPNIMMMYVSPASNSISGSHNGWKGIAQDAQNNGAQSLLQQNMSIQANTGDAGAAADADKGALSLGVHIDATKNIAAQAGSVGNPYPFELSYMGALAAGDNAVMDSYNEWKGVSQGAQNSGAASLIQQNLALQANEGDSGSTAASANDQSAAGAVNLSYAKNVAAQRGAIFFNSAAGNNTGANAVVGSHNDWKGIAQNAQNSGLHSLMQQSIALQLNAGDEKTIGASADDQSSAHALDVAAAKNMAVQNGEVTENFGAFTYGGGNRVADSHNYWKGLGQNAQNSGAQSSTQQNVAMQVNDAASDDVKASADEQSEALAVGVALAKNVGDQHGQVTFSTANANNTGHNTVADSHNNWTGIAQGSQMSGVQSLTQQNLAVQVSAGVERVEATADDQSAAGAAAVVLAKNVAGQSADLVYNSASASVSGDNSIANSYNGWKGIAQNAQNSGAQSLIQQNAVVQLNRGDVSATAAGADDESFAAAIGLAAAGNTAEQAGNIIYGFAFDTDTGSNSIDGSFNGGKGLSQNAQSSGVQSLIQKNVAVQVNDGGQEVEVSATDASLALALNVDLASNVAAQEGTISGATGEFLGVTGGNSISGSFNHWSGVSQNVQNSGVQAMVQQNVAVQVNR